MRDEKAGATTLAEMREDYDWIEAFGYAGQPDTCATSCQSGPDMRRAHPTAQDVSLDTFAFDDVEAIEAASEGEHDEDDWLALGRIKDGRWFLLSAGCDYTGWDCRAGGTTTLAPDRETLVKFGTTADQRERLGLEAIAMEDK